MKNSELRAWLNMFPDKEIVIKICDGEVHPNIIDCVNGKIILYEDYESDLEVLYKTNLVNAISNGYIPPKFGRKENK